MSVETACTDDTASRLGLQYILFEAANAADYS